eukprot:2862724-Amphidinium_carterae.2
MLAYAHALKAGNEDELRAMMIVLAKTRPSASRIQLEVALECLSALCRVKAFENIPDERLHMRSVVDI